MLRVKLWLVEGITGYKGNGGCHFFAHGRTSPPSQLRRSGCRKATDIWGCQQAIYIHCTPQSGSPLGFHYKKEILTICRWCLWILVSTGICLYVCNYPLKMSRNTEPFPVSKECPLKQFQAKGSRLETAQPILMLRFLQVVNPYHMPQSLTLILFHCGLPARTTRMHSHVVRNPPLAESSWL